jgi:hypothetical protein
MCMCARVCTCVLIESVRVHAFVQAYVYVCLCACVSIYIYIYIYIYIIYIYVCVCVLEGWRRDAPIAMFLPAPQGGWTPLHRASQSGHLEVVEALLAKGADVEAKNNVSIARATSMK